MYKRYTLNNGLKVIYEHIPYVKSISIGVWIKSGSRFENQNNNGISHFLEHMLFKGTKNRTSKQISEEIESLGGQLNAFTSRESTCYYVKLLDTHFDTGIDVLSDMVINPSFLEEEIEKEKSVILEEISMYEDLPEDLISDIQFKALWGDNTLSYPILGTYDTVSSFSRDIIIDYYSKKYTPTNTVISVVGNFEEDKLISEIEKRFSSWENNNGYKITEDSPVAQGGFLVKNKPIEQVHVALTLKGLESGDKGLYSLLAINNYFGSGTSSKLFQRIREDKGYVYSIYSYPSSYKNTGMFSIYFACNPSCVEDAIRLVKEEISNIYTEKISSSEIEKIKEQLKGSYILGLEGVSNIMFGIGKAELILGRVLTTDEAMEKIDSITKDDIDEVIDYIFKDGIISAVAVGRDIAENDLIKYVNGN
ncbi:M16 family metallopeptidase [Clostridium cylindrosporum]|uniref:Putative Zn-dependent peptidase n=1 Tax=Clostridium cylindrosporum DSM 605 TaxID=1121307 RepID=A0A0J8G608_CLOCY|nr:pitrilysin family protein [Clostridium cylindrosporum]KMT23056.1 putative Zn-dependent peptidase [Clostridium cylindrosporum DSM 605]